MDLQANFDRPSSVCVPLEKDNGKLQAYSNLDGGNFSVPQSVWIPNQRSSAKPSPTKTLPTKPSETKNLPTKPSPTKPSPAKPSPTNPSPAKSSATKPSPTNSSATKPSPTKWFSSLPLIIKKGNHHFPYWTIPTAILGVIFIVTFVFFIRKNYRRRKCRRTVENYLLDSTKDTSEGDEMPLLLQENLTDDEILITA